MTVKITNYGGIVTSIVIPDRDGNRGDIVCGFDTWTATSARRTRPTRPTSAASSAAMRHASRTASSPSTVSRTRSPPTTAPTICTAGSSVSTSACGMPNTVERIGRLRAATYSGQPRRRGRLPRHREGAVEYRLTQDNELRIHYTAETDRATPLSLTNHTYFNLNGFADKVLDHTVQIHERSVPGSRRNERAGR